MKKTSLSIITIMTVAILFILLGYTKPISSFAQTSGDAYTVLAPLPCIESGPTQYIDSSGQTQTNPGIKCAEGNGSLQTKVDFKTYVQYTINLLIALSAVLAVVMIVLGGIEYMTSQAFQSKSDGLKRVKNAVVGLLLVLTSFIILRTVDPRLVEIPNTLVPQININDKLAMDANSILLRQLQSDAELYELDKASIEKLLQTTQKDIQTKNAELADVNKKIANFSGQSIDSKEEYDSLIFQKSKLETDLWKLNINYQTSLAKNAINDVLLDSALKVKENASKEDASTAIKQLDINNKKINEYRDIATSKLKKLGDPQATEVHATANHAEKVISLNKLSLSINSADSFYLPNGFGGTSSIRSIELTQLNGKRRPFTPSSLANEYVQTELDKIRSSLENFKDEKLKTDLEKRIAEIQVKIDTLAVFNK